MSQMYIPRPLGQRLRRVWGMLCAAMKRFSQIDGAQSAAAFAHYAFFSLFPLIILAVTIAAAFIDRDRAGTEIITHVETYVPIGVDRQSYVFDTIAGVIKARGRAGAVAFFMLVWGAMQFFDALICATNKAWGTQAYNWWRLPLKSLGGLAIMVCVVLLGVAVPLLVKMAKNWMFQVNDFSSWIYTLGSYVIPLLVVFLSLSLFYRLAPRRRTGFGEVWAAALCATALLQAAEIMFVIYLKHFATLNAVYGAFGGIIALLMWIYLSGCIVIFGACLCAAQAEGRTVLAKAIMANTTKDVEA